MTWIDPRDFGAVGDGVTDDTAAFQAAIDHLIAARSQQDPHTYLCGPLHLSAAAFMKRRKLRKGTR